MRMRGLAEIAGDDAPRRRSHAAGNAAKLFPVFRALLLTLAALLASCASPGRRGEETSGLTKQTDREAILADRTDWSMTGKIAVSDGRDGGSGRIDWRQHGEHFVIEIRAPVSRRTWRLTGKPGSALLEGLDGGPRSGPSAEALLQREVGWTLPVSDLVAWARGARGAGEAEIEFDPDGLPRHILQRGWMVEYRAWAEGEPVLPRKVFASSGERRVRLVVDRWNVGSAAR
jgi:outer membrane lipoprotein LolB